MKKPSFILYQAQYEPLKNLPDHLLASIFRACFEYHDTDGAFIPPDDIKVAFGFLKIQFDIDAAKYAAKIEQCSQAGKKHSGNQFSNRNECSKIGTNGTSVPNAERNGTNGTVIVNDNVNDNDIKKRFIKPSIDEIRAYCEERHNGINPERFFNYYEAIGWKFGKAPMKDWKAAIRTWELKQEPAQAEGQTNTREVSLKDLGQIYE